MPLVSVPDPAYPTRGITFDELRPSSFRARFDDDVLALQPRAIGRDMSVEYTGAVKDFALMLYATPWPSIGQKIGFDTGLVRFVGRVESIKWESANGGRFKAFVQGSVIEFVCEGLLNGVHD